MLKDAKPEKTGSGIFGKWATAAIIGIVAILIIFLLVNLNQLNQASVVPPATCGEKVIAYINNNLVQPGTSATLISINESRGMYELKSQYQSQAVTIYATKDCALLFTNTLDMNAPPAKTAPVEPPKKTDRPVADLFVMAFCPYGTQAETVMRPVVDLLGTSADIRVRYITTSNGTSASDVLSLHGPTEAREDLRQLCIRGTTAEKYWDYLKAFNNQCYPVWQNTSVLDSCRKNITAALGIDLAGTDACASGDNGLSLLKTDQIDSTKFGVTGSPTLIINGVESAASRTPEGYKEAICNSFNTPPAACNTTLSAAPASSTTAGACG